MLSFFLLPSSTRTTWRSSELSFLLALIPLISLMTPALFYLVAIAFSKTRKFSTAGFTKASLYSRSFSLASKSFSVLDSRPKGFEEADCVN